ncbi:unnamed protein product [Rhizophagus irregularis]|nr:unnamed protein product [Rhizophagus irregularis]
MWDVQKLLPLLRNNQNVSFGLDLPLQLLIKKSDDAIYISKDLLIQYQFIFEIFWDSFREAVNINKNGYDGKTRILSIIAKKFPYEEIKSNLNVSNDAIHYARNHALIHGAGSQVWNKPVITREKLSTEMQEQ